MLQAFNPARRAAIGVGASAVLAGALAACAKQQADGTTVTVTPAMIAAQAKTTLDAVSGAVTVYLTGNPGAISADDQANIASAESAANAAIGSIATLDLSNVASTALSIANSIVTIVNAIPALPIAVRVGAVAFQVLVANLQPLLSAPAAGATSKLPQITHGAVICHLVKA
jgi:hypothetical protein